MRFPYVLFDLDGTLIDSGAMIVASMRHAVTTVLGREVPEDELKAAVGGPGLIAQMRALDESRVDELVDGVPRAQRAAPRARCRPAAGSRTLLGRLQARRAAPRDRDRQAPRHRAARVRRPALARASSFDVVVGAEDTSRHKPHPEPLLYALDRLGAEPSEAAYVGDSPFDVEAAKAAGCFAVAVTWGGIHGEERLAAKEPDAIVHDPEELLGVL